jgi:hypothetical protein
MMVMMWGMALPSLEIFGSSKDSFLYCMYKRFDFFLFHG